MNFVDVLCIIAALIVFVTAVARLNDITLKQTSKRWWARRLGLAMVTAAMAMFIASYFTVAAPHWILITKFVGLWGLAITWITTPNAEPWWKFITRHDVQVERRHGGD